MLTVSKNILQDIYKERPRESKKYDFGLLIIIGGSDFYSGSPALSALAAFRTGVDMVRIIAPKRAADIIASFSPNLAAYPLEGKWLEKKHLSTLISMVESAKMVAEGKTAVVIGGGMGRSKETQLTILEFLEQISVPVVIDADAIHAISKTPQIANGKSFLFTPHSYEFFVLTGQDISKVPYEEKLKIVQEKAAQLKSTILLKGATDIISDGKEVALNTTGTAYLAKGGCGDTLAGICGALMARKIDSFTAAQAGAFINGKAGELVAQKVKDSLLATDVIEAIPEVLRREVESPNQTE